MQVSPEASGIQIEIMGKAFLRWGTDSLVVCPMLAKKVLKALAISSGCVMTTLSEKNSVDIEVILEPLEIRGFKNDQVF